ncbi:ABC transporter substrate-binding protein [Achromobacter xylosoxidans]|uniref:ABC transporter substrate-binding protein n=1 Tax=Alcaligenes xylosoxydans xylosoxydans TaxID=85698 RepID=UPI000665D320|nr:ABC transporter substrate-binding protein [Achromobacter xylosoxidans]
MKTPRHARQALAAFLAWIACAAALAQDIPVTSIQAVTGPIAFAGAPFQKGIRLAVDELNAKGGINGRKIKLMERDSASDKGQAINLASQAIDRDRALLTLGPSATSDSVAVVPVFNDRKAPVLSFATSDVVLKSGPWSLKFQQSPSVPSPLVARYLLDKTRIRKVAIVYDRTNEALIESKSHFHSAFKEGGGAVVTEEAVIGSDANFLLLATKLKSAGIDGVYLATYAEQSANIMAQLRQAGLENIQYVGTIAVVSPKFLAAAGKAAEGTIAVADFVAGLDRPMNQAFEASFKARYGEEPDSWAAVAYSLAQVGFAAIREAGPKPTREGVRDAYLRLKDVPVVIGGGLWNQTDRKPHYGAQVLVVRDGRFVLAP